MDEELPFTAQSVRRTPIGDDSLVPMGSGAPG
jgi:hypothetical protein